MSSNNDSYRPRASVVFVGIPEFAQKPVVEQARLRARLDAAIVAGVGVNDGALNEADRMVLDAPEGGAIVVLGDPPAALAAAMRARDAGEGASLVIGINHGPVKLAAGARNGSLMVGDGIDAAVAITQFAGTGKLLMSRDFRDALAESAPAHAAKFHRVADVTDASVRTHEVYAEDLVTDARAGRRAIVGALLACVGIVALGGVARVVRENLATARQPATLVFDIRPQGDIYLDGAMKGKAPAVTRLQVSSGTHVIEVRNGRFPAFVTEVTLSPGEQMEIRHSFIAPTKPKRPGLLEKFKFWQ